MDRRALELSSVRELTIACQAIDGRFGDPQGSHTTHPKRALGRAHQVGISPRNGTTFSVTRSHEVRPRQFSHGSNQQQQTRAPSRALPQNIIINQRIASCVSAQQVFEEIETVRKKNLVMNSVNMATALHRIAKTGNHGEFARLRTSEDYSRLLEIVEESLQVKLLMKRQHPPRAPHTAHRM